MQTLLSENSIRFCRSLIFLSLLAFPASGIALGQVLYGTLTGSVTDPSSAAVPNARVEAVNTETGVTRQTASNESGVYVFSDLQPGIYKVTISGPSFRTVINEGMQIEANTTARFDALLQVSQVSESVIVSASAVALQTDRADVHTTITPRQVTELPLTGSVGRNFQSLLTIVPGTVNQGEQNSAAGSPQRAISFNVNGVSRLQNDTRLDGASITYPWLPTNLAYVPPAEALDTVNIVTNAYDAEQGMAGGAVVSVIMRSGTNDFHGAAWVFDQNSHFKTRNFFQTTPGIPKDIVNQYGARFGGPIKKNKLFFFSDWEKSTRRQSSPIRLYSLPTADLRSGDFTATGTTIYDPASSTDPSQRTPFPGNRIPSTRIDLAAQELLKRLPSPTGAGYNNNYTASGVGTFNRDNVDFKVNYNATDKVTMFARYSISPSNIFDPPAFGDAGGPALNGGQLGNAPGRTQIAGTGVTWTLNSSMIIDANAGYTRQRLGAENIDIGTNFGLDVLKIPGTNGPDRLQGGIPSFQIGSNWPNFGNENTGNPFLFRDNQYVANVNYGWVKGPHALRFGLDYRNQQLNHFQPQGGTFQTVRGTFVFNGQLTALQPCTTSTDVSAPCRNAAPVNQFNNFADFLLGLPNRAGKVDQLLNPNSLRMETWALYARDQFQVTRKLTVNYGLRWEIYPFPHRDHGGVSRFDPSDGNVYVGGYGGVPVDTGASSGHGLFLPRIGIAYRVTDKMVIRTGYAMSADPRPFIDFRNSYPVVNAWEMPNAPYTAATTLRRGLDPAAAGQTVPDLSKGVLRLPSGTSTGTYPKDAMRKYIQSWNFMIQRELPRGFNGQIGYVGTRATGQMQFININTSAPGTGNAGRVLARQFGLLSDINMTIPFKTTTYDGLQTQLIRHWGSSQIGAVYTFSKTINWADNDGNPRIVWPDAWQRNRGVATYDRPHNFQAWWTTEAPFGRAKRWAKSGVAGALLGGWELNGILSRTSGTPLWITADTGNLNSAGSSQVADQLVRDVPILGGIGNGRTWFDPNAYAPVILQPGEAPRFGTAGRNNIRGPSFFNIDAGLFRNLRFGERYIAQLRVEALNVLNHPNFSTPGVNASAPVRDAAGHITGALNNFGVITSTVGSDRQFRFGAKFSF